MQAITGPWSLDEIETYLTEAAVPIRVAYLGRSGWPAVQSLWYLYDAGVAQIHAGEMLAQAAAAHLGTAPAAG